MAQNHNIATSFSFITKEGFVGNPRLSDCQSLKLEIAEVLGDVKTFDPTTFTPSDWHKEVVEKSEDADMVVSLFLGEKVYVELHSYEDLRYILDMKVDHSVWNNLPKVWDGSLDEDFYYLTMEDIHKACMSYSLEEHPCTMYSHTFWGNNNPHQGGWVDKVDAGNCWDARFNVTDEDGFADLSCFATLDVHCGANIFHCYNMEQFKKVCALTMEDIQSLAIQCKVTSILEHSGVFYSVFDCEHFEL